MATLGAAITDGLPFLRAQAASMQTQQIVIVRNGTLADGTPDPTTGEVAPVPSTVYTGAARVKPLKRVSGGGDTNDGETTASASIFIVSVPHNATGIRPGDIVRITASLDPDLLEDTLRVVVIEDSEQTTARRITCELVEMRAS